MTMEDMSIPNILRDPLIRQMMHADGVSLQELANLLREVAADQAASRRARRARHLSLTGIGPGTNPKLIN